MKALFQLPDKDDLLARDEMIEMTDSQRRENQIEWLKKNKYIYEVMADGWPRVHRYYRMCRMLGVEPSEFIQGAKKGWELDLSTIS